MTSKMFMDWLEHHYEHGTPSEDIFEQARDILNGRLELKIEDDFVIGGGNPESNTLTDIIEYIREGVEIGNINGVFGENLIKILNSDISLHVKRTFRLKEPK